ncbi:hypothetical protein [Robiginitalea aurantiaca]|uniref:Lipoprotein n=1 Tax=Robiginitalea aurantiaca TaxID=3056915 RepID=A0ABT7WC48_9FLAO|nr:hypothetical protein [Robiginitalea aurantiaca]MDM9630491.1 hypothetical protein [Robiginitalea aurantiaca]
MIPIYLVRNSFKTFLLLSGVLLMLSCASGQPDDPTLSPEEYAVVNDFYERSHLPLYHKTVNTSLPTSLSDYDSIYVRKRYPERSSDLVLNTLLPPETLQQVQEKLEESEELRFREEYLRHIELSSKKSGSVTISRPIVLDSIAIIRQIGITNDPVFILKKDSDGHWELRFTFFEDIESE